MNDPILTENEIDDPWLECSGNCASITYDHGSSDVDGHDTRSANCDGGYVCCHCQTTKVETPEPDEVPTIYDEFGVGRCEPDPDGPVVPTVDEIEDARSAAGGWSRAQLAE